MRRRGVMSLVVAVVLAGVTAGFAQEAPPRLAKPVTLALKNVPLADAVRQIIAKTDLSVIVLGELPMEPKVTMRLEDADPVNALYLLTQAGQLFFSTQQIGPGRQVAAIGPMPTASGPWGGGRSGPGPAAVQRSASSGAGIASLAPPALPEGIANLIADLEAKDLPFREAVGMISKQLPESARTRIVVDLSVPNDVRVTARLHKMPLGWVLGNLVQQAGLTYSIQVEPDPQVVAAAGQLFEDGSINQEEMQRRIVHAPRVHTIYIVPRPELSVGGAGGGGGGGG